MKKAASGGAAHSTENQAKRYLQIPANVVSHWFTSKRTKITNTSKRTKTTNMLLLVHSVSSILHGKKEKEGWGVGGFRRKISSFEMCWKEMEGAGRHTRRAKREQ